MSSDGLSIEWWKEPRDALNPPSFSRLWNRFVLRHGFEVDLFTADDDDGGRYLMYLVDEDDREDPVYLASRVDDSTLAKLRAKEITIRRALVGDPSGGEKKVFALAYSVGADAPAGRRGQWRVLDADTMPEAYYPPEGVYLRTADELRAEIEKELAELDAAASAKTSPHRLLQAAREAATKAVRTLPMPGAASEPMSLRRGDVVGAPGGAEDVASTHRAASRFDYGIPDASETTREGLEAGAVVRPVPSHVTATAIAANDNAFTLAA